MTAQVLRCRLVQSLLASVGLAGPVPPPPGTPAPLPSSSACGISSKAVFFRKPTAAVPTWRRLQGTGRSFGLRAELPVSKPRCQVGWPLPYLPCRFLVGTRRLRAVLGEQALASACSGRAGRLPHLLLFLRLPEGRARPGRVQPCSPQHACLIEEWDGEDPTLTVHRRQLHTHAVEGEPGALVGAGGPVQPLLSSKLRPPVQGACLVVCLSLRGMAGRWAALVSGGSRGGPVLSCPEVSCLRGQAYEVGGCHVHILGVKSSDSGRWLRCRGW